MKFPTPLKILGLLVTIFMAMPALLFAFLGKDAILPIILYFQLLILWGQIEVALRQHTLFSVQYEPTFSVGSRVEIGEKPRESLLLRNTSSNTAYNIMVGRVLDKEGRPIHPDEWEEIIYTLYISSLSPGEEKILCSYDAELLNAGWSIEVSTSISWESGRTFTSRPARQERS